MLFKVQHELCGIGRTVAGNEVADFDEIALGIFREP